MNNAYDEILDFVTSSPSLDAIVAFTHSARTLERVEYLLAAAEDETMTEAEREELREFHKANEFMEQLKVRAKRRLGIADE